MQVLPTLQAFHVPPSPGSSGAFVAIPAAQFAQHLSVLQVLLMPSTFRCFRCYLCSSGFRTAVRGYIRISIWSRAVSPMVQAYLGGHHYRMQTCTTSPLRTLLYLSTTHHCCAGAACSALLCCTFTLRTAVCLAQAQGAMPGADGQYFMLCSASGALGLTPPTQEAERQTASQPLPTPIAPASSSDLRSV